MFVPNIKTNVMYERAKDLVYEVYSETENMKDSQALLLRKRSLIVVRKISRAIVENNKKMKIKLLNEAKEQVVIILDESYEMYKEGLIFGETLDNYGTQVLKLIHYQFGKRKK